MWIVQLQNIGRGKVTRTVEVQDTDGIIDEVSKHLMSKEIYLQYIDNNDFRVVVGFAEREVGKVHVLDWGQEGVPADFFKWLS